MKDENSQQVIKLAFHRNGICGLGFHVAIVKDIENGKTREMLVVRFEKHAEDRIGNVLCAAFDLKLLAEKNIEFGRGNSWRGDRYHEVVDAAIEHQNKQALKGMK